jgi:DNA (cytosine-5)-methyltransferase 1
MKHGSLFSGIGGFDLAAEWMGWENVFHCEWMEFPRKVLDYHFPNADSHIDICKTDFKKYANKIDILTGGFPCQPFSLAGKRKGTKDERFLWHEMLRAVQEIKPKYIIGENVFGITNIDGGLVFQQVCLDLENEGYEVQPFIIPACAKNAPHRRDRVWFIAYTKSKRSRGLLIGKKQTHPFNGIIGSNGDVANTTSTRRRKDHGFRESRFNDQKSETNNWGNFPTQSPVCGGDDGIPTQLDGITFSKWRAESIKGYGNAIVPQIAYSLFEIIQELNENN